MGNKPSRKTPETKTRRRVNIALIISGLALLVSIFQLIVSSPFFLDAYNKPQIIVQERANIMSEVLIVINHTDIKNIGRKTANNLTLAIDAFNIESITFNPDNAFKLIDSIAGSYYFKNRYFFTKEKFVPNEWIIVFIESKIDSLAKVVGADTLKPYWSYNCQEFVPHVAELVSDVGYANIERPEKFMMQKFIWAGPGKQYKLKGEPIKR